MLHELCYNSWSHDCNYVGWLTAKNDQEDPCASCMVCRNKPLCIAVYLFAAV